MMTGLFRSLTLRSARHSLARKGGLKCGRQETHSYLVVCLHSSSFWLRVFVLFSIFEEIFTSKDLEDGRKSCQVPARFQDRLIDLKKVSQEKSGVNHQEIIRYPLKFSEFLYGIISRYVTNMSLQILPHPVVLLVVFKLNTPIRGCISSNSGLGPYEKFCGS